MPELKMPSENPVGLRFTSIRLQNWKNFRSASTEFSSRVFIVGPNASGKSNFLDCFRFLRDISSVGGGLQAAVTKRGGVSAIRSLSARKTPTIKLEARVGTTSQPDFWTYEVEFGQDNLRTPTIKSEVVRRDGELVVKRPNDDDLADPLRLSQTHLEQISANAGFRELAEFFASIRYQHLVPQLIREPDRSVGRENDPFGGDFLAKVASTQKKTRDSRLAKIRDALKIAVPQLEELLLDQDAKGFWHLKAKYQHWRGQGAWQTEENFSDGTLRLLGLLWVILDGNGPLLLEEPELSLHPAVVEVLPAIIYRMQRRNSRQVITTTHSDALLRDRGIGLDEVLLIQPDTEGSKIESCKSRKDIKALLDNGVTLGEAVLPRARPKNIAQLSLFDF